MSNRHSPLRYPGGKAKLAPFLAAVIQHNRFIEPHYVEPYAGGAGAALYLLFHEYVSAITINDADPRMRCFWHAVVHYNRRFIDALEAVEVTVEEWHRQREIYQTRDLRKVFELGFSVFFLNRTSRSGIIHNAGPIGGYDQTGNYLIDARFNRTDLVERIRRIGERADRIRVSGLDGLELLRSLSAARPTPSGTFVYLDPPYYRKGAKLYLNSFEGADHEALAQFVADDLSFPWVMTYDNVPEIRALYQQFNPVAFSLSYSAYERREGEELLIHPEAVQVPATVLEEIPSVAIA